jgi:hypothetical protein
MSLPYSKQFALLLALAHVTDHEHVEADIEDCFDAASDTLALSDHDKVMLEKTRCVLVASPDFLGSLAASGLFSTEVSFLLSVGVYRRRSGGNRQPAFAPSLAYLQTLVLSPDR